MFYDDDHHDDDHDDDHDNDHVVDHDDDHVKDVPHMGVACINRPSFTMENPAGSIAQPIHVIMSTLSL